MVNKKFINVLQTYLVSDEDQKYEHLFPLPWCLKDKNKTITFTIEECLGWCSRKQFDQISAKEKEDFEKIICSSVNYVVGTENKMLQFKLNCSFLPSSDICMQIGEKLLGETVNEKLSYLLHTEHSLNVDLLEKRLNLKKEPAKKILSCLQKSHKICVKDETATLVVKNPYLTEAITDKLKVEHDYVCIEKLLQFLRMRLPMDEGPYNELYHLNNCDCHSDGWIFLVGDRVLAGTANIELYDVLCYKKEKKLSYLLHVKKGSDATSSRAACSQVNVCKDEIVRATTVDTAFDIFDQFFERAIKGRGSRYDWHKPRHLK